jgi:hypothetical protein
MWWRLGVLGAVSAGLLLVLFVPVETVDIVVEMPRARDGVSMPADDLEALLNGVTTTITVLFLVGYVALVLWIGRHIVRKHGRRGSG